MGLYDATTETTAANLISFLQHYIPTTLENIQLQLGVRKCSLHYDYNIRSGLATVS